MLLKRQAGGTWTLDNPAQEKSRILGQKNIYFASVREHYRLDTNYLMEDGGEGELF